MKERLDRMTWEIFQIERDDSPSAKGCKNENWKIIEYYSQAIQHRIPDTCLRENGADSGVLQMPLRSIFITNQTNNYYSTEQNHYLHCTTNVAQGNQSQSQPRDGPAVPLGLRKLRRFAKIGTSQWSLACWTHGLRGDHLCKILKAKETTQ